MMFWVLGVSAQTVDSSRVDSFSVTDSLLVMEPVQEAKVEDTLLEPTYWNLKEKKVEMKSVRIPPGNRTGYFIFGP